MIIKNIICKYTMSTFAYYVLHVTITGLELFLVIFNILCILYP